MAIIPASLAADYLLAHIDEDSGDTISNLKLQKLLYYSQAVHLALHNEPLFRDKIKRWLHGPVVPGIWQKYKAYGNSDLPKPAEADFDIIDEERKESMAEAYNVFGQFSAWKLRNMTHAEPPWRDTAKNAEITPGAIKAYFREMVEV